MQELLQRKEHTASRSLCAPYRVYFMEFVSFLRLQ